ncbi:Cytochrome c1 precursor [Candidatus Glomeribacter gigasporarum BEG34]|uniref:Cytochrome c1 n=1 Tax=Candidatus Glomeribacter gigasporarum BEG34 TaxID=1070319 RepID=G2J9Q2_9BURK|nr:cytochrome c1 [Candidatus Glomeribacter gigasporarum]CCD29499.1 Cytochrome c1 precursor [Candidatus Glomeribacter gigasporarum BEG34]
MKIRLPLLLLLIALLAPFARWAHAEEPAIPLDRAPDRSNDLVALQRGARLFINYCLNCHSAREMRYSRLQALGIPKQAIEDQLLFTADRIGDTMTVALRAEDANEWFGTAAPDLSVIARARGADWLYTYLRSFYRDDTRPTGWNNRLFENVAMPHVLWELQGQRVLDHPEGAQAAQGQMPARYRQLTPGALTPLEYDSAMADLVSYLVWMAEPTQQQRKRIGVWVVLFLGIFSVLAWRLNAAYWHRIKAD